MSEGEGLSVLDSSQSILGLKPRSTLNPTCALTDTHLNSLSVALDKWFKSVTRIVLHLHLGDFADAVIQCRLQANSLYLPRDLSPECGHLHMYYHFAAL